MSNRPVFIKKSHRGNRRPQRFHGAFTGGYSAGYHNTVGSAEGWKPIDLDHDHDNEDEGENRGRDGGGTSDGGRRRKRKWKEQKVEDYMDDHDLNEWGGPNAVRTEYEDQDEVVSAARRRERQRAGSGGGGGGAALPGPIPTEFVDIATPDASLGLKLLRKLGWRGGSGGGKSAYVPLNNDDKRETSDKTKGGTSSSGGTTEEAMFLSHRRIKKIQLQQSQTQIPPPKLNLYGMGYEPYKNAPEFAAHKERRQRLAAMRAKAATGGSDGRNRGDVYRTSDLLDDDDEEKDGVDSARGRREDREGESRHQLAYETAEDFVGTKGVGGFALHDDDDDVYDAPAASSSALGGVDIRLGGGSSSAGDGRGEYNTEIYEAESDDDGDHHGGGPAITGVKRSRGRGNDSNKGAGEKGDADDFAGALSGWAAEAGGGGNLPIQIKPSTTQSDVTKDGAASTKTATVGLTSDGRPPLPGFVLGGSGGSKQSTERFPGPDVPSEYQITRHVFAEHDNPVDVKKVSIMTKREMMARGGGGARKEQPIPKKEMEAYAAGDKQFQADHRREQGPMAGAAFAGLAAAMKDRFTSSSTSATLATASDTDAGRARGAKETQPRVGLHVPAARTAGPTTGDDSAKADADGTAHLGQPSTTKRKDVVMNRKVSSFVPSSLLCKRFRVRPPSSSSLGGTNKTSGGVAASSSGEARAGDDDNTESSYFQREILGRAKAATGRGASTKERSEANNDNRSSVDNTGGKTGSGIEENVMMTTIASPEEDVADRPPMDLFKSIFEPDSESSSSDESEDSDIEDGSETAGKEEAGGEGVASQAVPPPPPGGIPNRPNKTDVPNGTIEREESSQKTTSEPNSRTGDIKPSHSMSVEETSSSKGRTTTTNIPQRENGNEECVELEYHNDFEGRRESRKRRSGSRSDRHRRKASSSSRRRRGRESSEYHDSSSSKRDDRSKSRSRSRRRDRRSETRDSSSSSSSDVSEVDSQDEEDERRRRRKRERGGGSGSRKRKDRKKRRRKR